jgi:hypothetical protein
MDIAPLTRDEIAQVLRLNKYHVTQLMLDQVCKLIRVFERDGYGISFDEQANARSIVSLRDYKNQMLTGVTKTATAKELEDRADDKKR